MGLTRIWTRIWTSRKIWLTCVLVLSSCILFTLLYNNPTFISKMCPNDLSMTHYDNSKELAMEFPSNRSSKNRTFKNSDSFHKTPLLALFTSWSADFNPEVKNNTCHNWGSLRPLVMPILFSNSALAAFECKNNGWTIFPLTHTEAGGLPVLKTMFLEVMRRFNASLYGYANGDILFGEDLIQTLLPVVANFTNKDNPLLIVGIRTNVNNVTSLEASSFRNLREASKTRGKLSIDMSQDYFITNEAYSWNDIPTVVIGRVAYDNWLVLHSIHKNYTVVDATGTVLTVHQTTVRDTFKRKFRPYPDFNTKLLHRYFKRIRYEAGTTSCIPIITKHSVNGEVFVSKRNGLHSFCGNPYGGNN